MELRSELSKQYIAEAFLLLLKENDFDKISIQQIANKAGLSHMAYYRNFKSKDEILIYHIEKITATFYKQAQLDIMSQPLEQIIIKVFQHLYCFNELSTLLLKNDKLYLIQSAFIKYFLLNSKNDNDKYYRLYIVGGLFSIYSEWVKSGAKLSPKEIAAYICNLI